MPENNQSTHRCLMCGAPLSGPPRQKYCVDCARVRHLACARDYVERKLSESQSHGPQKNCPICGKPVPDARRTCCSRACAGVYRQNYKVCVVCGKSFPSHPSEGVRCCSPECSSIHRTQLHATDTYAATDAAFFAGKERYDATHQGEKHAAARSWVFYGPDGTEYQCRNLKKWLRDHEDMLDGTVQQAWDGISKIKYTMQGKRKRGSSQWKGWTLKSWGD